MSRRMSGSSAENGSSNSRISGSLARARARPTALLHAAAELVRVGVAEAAQADQVQHVVGPLQPAGLAPCPAPRDRRPRCRAGGGGGAGRSAGRPCSSSCAAARGAAPGSAAVTSSPSISTWPAVGSTRRDRQRTSVDLPEPERPMTTNSSPSADGERDVAHGRDVAGPGQLGPGQVGEDGIRRCGRPSVRTPSRRRGTRGPAMPIAHPRPPSPSRSAASFCAAAARSTGLPLQRLRSVLHCSAGGAACRGSSPAELVDTTAGTIVCRSPMTA